VTDWEAQYRKGETPWEKGEPSPPLEDYLQNHQLPGRVLVPGCGLGHDARLLAARGGADEVVGLDIAPWAVERARELAQSERESYVVGDLFDLPGSWRGRFDWICEHTCFCAIDPSQRDDYVRAAHGILREGGGFVGVFFLDPYDEDHPYGGPPFGASELEIRERFGTLFEFRSTWAPERTYAGREGREWMALLRKKA